MLKRLAFATSLVALPFMTACDGSDPLGDEEARLTVLLTDAPATLEEAVVTISAVYLQGDSEDDEASGRVYLRDESFTTDIADLVNQVTEVAEDVVVPAGTYGQLRFVIDGAYIRVNVDGTSKVYATDGYDEAPESVDGVLLCPSCSQSGIKVVVPGGLHLDDDEVLVVDFDLSESVGHEAGQSGKWIMRPTLKAAMQESVGDVTVNLALASGVTLPAVGGQAVTLAGLKAELRGAASDATVAGEMATFTDPNSDGTFTASFANVVPGDYILSLVLPTGLTVATSPVLPVTVTVGEDGLTQNLTISAATATG